MQLNKLKKGVTIVGGRVKALHIERHQKGSKKYDWVKIVITEGKNRQIKKMFQKIGYDVTKLKRISIGELRIGALKKGELKQLSYTDLLKIFKKNPLYKKANPIRTIKTTKRKKRTSRNTETKPKRSSRGSSNKKHGKKLSGKKTSSKKRTRRS